MNNAQKAALISSALSQYILQKDARNYHRQVLRSAIRAALEQTPDERRIADVQRRCCPLWGPPDPVDAMATQHLAAVIGASPTWPKDLFYNSDMGELMGY
ncbi:hypothetical protein [Pseudomonas syringae]|uniref:hypothetical protein n=1 Tax=Pseudomonas syringae TaxID=317 RepID=UPI000517A89A|nr:hypothetical protein [Pseudomonas syringae]